MSGEQHEAILALVRVANHDKREVPHIGARAGHAIGEQIRTD